MHFGLLAHLPVVVCLALTLVVPFRLPRFGMVAGALGTLAGGALCLNASGDEFAQVIAHQLGTAALIASGLWLIAACGGVFRHGRVTAAAA